MIDLGSVFKEAMHWELEASKPLPGKGYCTIYLVTNIITGLPYVGQTWNTIEYRFYYHIWTDGCRKLHGAIKEYGKDNFIIEPIVSIINRQNKWLTQACANKIEDECIKKYNSIDNGYNIRGGGSKGFVNQETRDILSALNTGDKHPMYNRTNRDLTGEGIKEKIKGGKNPMAKLNDEKVTQIKRLLEAGKTEYEIAPDYGVTSACINLILNNKNWRHIAWIGDHAEIFERNMQAKEKAHQGKRGFTPRRSQAKSKAEVKLSDDQIREMRTLFGTLNDCRIAEKFKVNANYVGAIRNGKAREDVK